MTSPLYLNPPFSLETKLKQEIKPQLQLFLSPHDRQASASASTTSSLSSALATCFNIPHDHKVDKYKSHGDRGSKHGELLFEDGGEFGFDHHEMESSDGSKWMPSKMTLMNPNCTATDEAKPLKFTLKFQAPPHDHHENNNTTSDIMINYCSQSSSSSNSNSNNNVRVCADCNTTATPLWRGGPRGPKSLCNACGIRQRKARRAMALAANGEIESSTKAKAIKDKKSRKSHIWSQCKKQCKPPHDHHHHHQSQKKKNLELSWSKNSTFQKVLPQDVEEAAILLMELSCGFIRT